MPGCARGNRALTDGNARSVQSARHEGTWAEGGWSAGPEVGRGDRGQIGGAPRLRAGAEGSAGTFDALFIGGRPRMCGPSSTLRTVCWLAGTAHGHHRAGVSTLNDRSRDAGEGSGGWACQLGCLGLVLGVVLGVGTCDVTGNQLVFGLWRTDRGNVRDSCGMSLGSR